MKKPYVPNLEIELQQNKKQLKSFITRTEKKLRDEHIGVVKQAENETWQHIDCLACANCCKVMSPTFSKEDIDRISDFLGMTPSQFKRKWLYFDRKSGDWMNVSQPCQFLDLETNMCKVYEVRPTDCAGFPHLSKRPFHDYFYIHKQNIEYCPATYSMIKRLRDMLQEHPL